MKHSINNWIMWLSRLRVLNFFSKKGFDIVIGIDNNFFRKFFFGKDGDISWMKKKVKENKYKLCSLQYRYKKL